METLLAWITVDVTRRSLKGEQYFLKAEDVGLFHPGPLPLLFDLEDVLSPGSPLHGSAENDAMATGAKRGNKGK